ncbi:MAG: hypothetical protein IPJ65_25730 [Archangiaceae bacterium]|nr:hypothetical protein [Archangiaceae bacterium]
MTVRRGVLAAFAVVLSACGVGEEATEASATAESGLYPGLKLEAPARDCRVLTVRPDATGTVVSLSGPNTLQVAPVGAAVQSMYRYDLNHGRELRHGLAEFTVPTLGGRITHAELQFADVHGYSLMPLPPDLHTLTLYSNADGAVSADDWFREGTPLATFTTDLNEAPAQHRYDLTGSVALGGRLGARLSLDRARSVGAYGSEFGGFLLELTVCNEAALPHGRPVGDPL